MPRFRIALAAIAVFAVPAFAQGGNQGRIEVTPASVELKSGETLDLQATAYDSSGNVLDVTVLFFSRTRGRLVVSREGHVEASKGGEYEVFVFVREPRIIQRITITVEYPPLREVAITGEVPRIFVGSVVRHSARVYDMADDKRNLRVDWTTSDPAIATVDRFGVVSGRAPGDVTITASAEGISSELTYTVEPDPIRTFTVESSADLGQTGDVIHFTTQELDGSGQPIADVPVEFTLLATPEDTVVAQSPVAEIDSKGRFVAEKGGIYTIVAMAAGHTAQHTVEITPRHVSREVKLVGRAPVTDVRTSDLWIWQGVDGRDYAITGTHGAAGATYFWDVTDPANPVMTDSLVVDARTTNDVKLTADGTVAIITREGASDRKNGIVIVDVTDPRNVEILSTFDDELTGGVHNVFVYERHVYAVNNGRRFDVINIEDPTNPFRVGRFELDTPGHAIHDIWIVDGIAYTSNWSDGVVLIDVGNGVAGGSPSNPVKIAQYADYRGATHAAFPYQSPTGKFYVFMGDEIGRAGFDGQLEGTPSRMAGYVHIVDFTDPMNPEEVARYEVPEAGSHNLWIEDDILYAAFYNGGLRVVDISGELKGNLGSQGREMAHYLSYDPDGKVANSAQVWGPQPYKGNLFFSDWNSGLWAVKVESPEPATP
ncbi:MAG: Ig-like domain-containing protein [Gemmatimonadales bacterium]